MIRTLGNTRVSSRLLLLGLCVSYALAVRLPVTWGWENGPLEIFQTLTLLAGLLVALLAAQAHRPKTASFWWIAALFWLAMLGRELAWGAVFLEPLGMDAERGPRYSSSVLMWKPAVAWMCCAMLLLCVFWVVRYRLFHQVLLRCQRESALPWGGLLVFVLAMVLSAAAEGHVGKMWWSQLQGVRLTMEEVAECWAYLAVWWAQWLLVQHMRQWRSGNYLQTLHFARNSLHERLERRSV